MGFVIRDRTTGQYHNGNTKEDEWTDQKNAKVWKSFPLLRRSIMYILRTRVARSLAYDVTVERSEAELAHIDGILKADNWTRYLPESWEIDEVDAPAEETEETE